MAKATSTATAVSSGPSSSTRSIPVIAGSKQLKRTDFVYGQFGENFTIEGLPDDAVCIGDRYQIGAKNAQLSDAFLGASGWVGFSKASH
jgi:hypothetical protein